MWLKDLAGKSLKVAVVGMGKMGVLHSCILNVLPNVRLVALCEKSVFTRRLLGKLFNEVRIVDDVENLTDLDLDAVFVATPIPSHYRVAKALIEDDVARNLFVEKTLAANYAEAKELCEVAKTSGGINMVGYLRRFYVTFRKAKDLLSQSNIGEISSFTAYAYSSDFLGIKKETASSLARGGVLKDLGCHAIDLALWFFGDLEVYAAGSLPAIREGSGDCLNFNVRSADGAEGEFNVSWRMESYRTPEIGFSITGSKGIVEVNDDRVELRLKGGKSKSWYRHNLDDNVPFWLGLPEYYREDLYFVKSVMEDHEAEPSFCAASKVDDIIGQVEKRGDKCEQTD